MARPGRLIMTRVLSVVYPPPTGAGEENWQPELAQAVPKSAGETSDLKHAPRTWDEDEFARRQVAGMVRRVFFPGTDLASRQVAITAVDARTDTANVCARLALTMAEDVSGSICAVQAANTSPSLRAYMSGRQGSCAHGEQERTAHPNCDHIRDNLWLLTREAFLRESYDRPKLSWFRSRLNQLRREFEYSIIQAPALTGDDAILLGQLCDGVILTLQAHCTRRAAARSAMHALRDANIRCLGFVLHDRTFPVPEAVYNNL